MENKNYPENKNIGNDSVDAEEYHEDTEALSDINDEEYQDDYDDEYDEYGDGNEDEDHDKHEGHEHHHHEICDCHCCTDGCDCGSDHEHIDEKILYKVIISTAAMLVSVIVPIAFIKIIIVAAAVLFCGFDMFKYGIKNIAKLSLEEKSLMTIAVVAAFIIGEYYEAGFVTILFKLGQYLEAKAISKSRGEINGLSQIRPETANVVNADGSVSVINASEIEVGTKIVVKSGERIPLDGTVISGDGLIDNSSLTGESVSIRVKSGDKILSGGINKKGVIMCETTSLFENSTATRIIKLVEEAAAQKGNTETFITKFAKIYTPIVVCLAILIAFFPPILGVGKLSVWISRSLVFLVTSCPCAFVISIPLSFYSGIGACSKKGILVKGSKFIEILADVDCVAFDKTGTATTGKLEVTSIKNYTNGDIKGILSVAESFSNHPIAKAVGEFFGNYPTDKASDVNEIPGMGVELNYDGKKYYVGSSRLIHEAGIRIDEDKDANIYIADEENVLGAVWLSDKPRKDAKKTVDKLKELGVKNVCLLTGDMHASAEFVRNEIGADSVSSNLLPEDKVAKMAELKETYKNVVFIGDGINDAPVLAASDCGIAMGMGSEAAIDTADVVLVKDKLFNVVEAIDISKKTIKIAKSNIAMALAVKIVILILGACGVVSMWAAVIADVGVMVAAVLNSTKLIAKNRNNDI